MNLLDVSYKYDSPRLFLRFRRFFKIKIKQKTIQNFHIKMQKFSNINNHNLLQTFYNLKEHQLSTMHRRCFRNG